MTSRVHHALASLHWEVGVPNQALEHIRQALSISQEIGYGPGIAHGLIALSDIQARRGNVDVAREHIQQAMTWLQLTEDQAGLTQARTRLGALEKGDSEELDPSTTRGWVKSHVTLTEGKVYCEFESPMAQLRS